MRKADWFIGALIAVVIIAMVSYYYRSINNIKNQNPDRPSVEETLNEIGNGKDATLEEEDAYNEEEYPDDSDTTNYTPEQPTIDDLADLNEVRAKEATPPSYNENASTAASANKTFLVVAGTFKQMINAENQLKKMKKMGFNNAEIGKFNKSAYASLVVDRFATSAQAKQFAKTLKAKHQIDAYVHKKR